MSPAGQGDNNATFLAEFRALRDHAGLDYTELAARAHYPSDVLKKAEAGPGLPGLPILAAYVRACDADVTEWEERWRLLADDADLGTTAPDTDAEDCGLPVRPAGASPAAKAGARVTVVPADVHDPERIKAALRAHRAREETSSDNGAAHGNGHAPGNGNGATSGWVSGWASDNDPVAGADAVNGGSTMLANGHHHRRHGAQTSASHNFAPGSSSASAAFWSSVTSEAESASGAPPASADPSSPAAPPEAVDPPSAATTPERLTSAETLEAGHSPATESAWKAPDLTAGHSSPNGRSYATSSNGYSPGPRDTRTTARARRGRPSGNSQLKLVVLVLVVLIGCILLITVA